jgi:hypothetical protein
MRAVFIVSVIALTLGLVLAGQQAATSTPVPAPAAAVEVKPENLCTIEGKVVNANTGEIIPKAVLMMRRADPERSPSGPPVTFTTSSGADGRFAMKDIEPGSYRLTVMRNGFVMSEYGSRGPMKSGTTLKLEPAQKMTSVDFKLTPHGVITGRIVDEDGEPLANVQIATVRPRFQQGRKQLTPMSGASTNDLGEFRLFGLAPGRFVLSATYTSRMMYEPAQDRSAAGASDESYLPAYYPGVTDPSAATAVEIAPGQQISGLEMRMSKVRTTRLRGRVNNMTGVRAQGIMVNIAPRNAMSYYSMNRTMAQGPQSRFEFRGLGPGSYTLTAVIPDGQTFYTARQPVEIGSDHIDNFVLNVASGVSLPGIVTVEGSAAGFDPTAVRLFLAPAASDGMMFSGPASDRIKEDGSFRLNNVSPDKYYIRLFSLPDGFYLKSVRIGDQLAADDVIDLTSGAAATIQVALAEGAAQIDGSVSNDKQEPVSGATVVLIPEKESRRTRQEYVKVATTDQHGRFTLKNVDPGDYRVYAWDDIENGSWMDPDVIKPVESKAKKLTLKERSKESVELRVIRNE